MSAPADLDFSCGYFACMRMIRGLQRQQVGEGIGLPPQLVGYHRRLARNRRYNLYPNTAALDRFNQSPVIAIAGEKHHLVDLLRHLHGVDRQFNFHVAFGPATAIACKRWTGMTPRRLRVENRP
jgi:hypothetical protein